MQVPNAQTFNEFDIDKFMEDNEKNLIYSEKTFEDSDDDTYVARDIKHIIQKKFSSKFLREMGFPATSVTINALKFYATGIGAISNVYVFQTRTSIQPAKWYTNISEPLPPRIPFTPKYTVDSLKTKETQGQILFTKFLFSNGVKNLSQQYNIAPDILKNVIYKRTDKLTNQRVFKNFPTLQFIKTFSKVINPDYWYIFPEELEENTIISSIDFDEQIKELLENKLIQMIGRFKDKSESESKQLILKIHENKLIEKNFQKSIDTINFNLKNMVKQLYDLLED